MAQKMKIKKSAASWIQMSRSSFAETEVSDILLKARGLILVQDGKQLGGRLNQPGPVFDSIVGGVVLSVSYSNICAWSVCQRPRSLVSFDLSNHSLPSAPGLTTSGIFTVELPCL